MKKKYLIIFVFIGVALFIFLNTFFKSREEYRNSYNFVITKIEISPTKTLIFYNNKEEITLWNYIITDYEKVEIGDLLCKKECSKYLYIYRKNNRGVYNLHLKINPTGLFPFEWFCN
ncbi:hypothetical protein [Flavobacterium sp. AJR]|uniref:hypothetical protein n=1 Tax=Flavobacterium sp. AJR TaxID=1979369 RepID=UPI000A3D6949|nr:hypothetical protein [Flavobacterium sp. AJR]OUL60733.1 hypothetical protein B8T70_18835 [Flavobacterium sp. AJR]